MMKKFLPIFIYFFLALTSSQAAEDKALPTLVIKTLDGKNFDLTKKRGKVVIINFWAQWCVDCRKEMPVLEEIYREYKSRGLEIIGINIDRKKDLKKVLHIASAVSYPNAMFYEAQKTSFDEPDSIPTNYVIDKNGNLFATLIGDDGRSSKKDFEEVLRPLLRK